MKRRFHMSRSDFQRTVSTIAHVVTLTAVAGLLASVPLVFPSFVHAQTFRGSIVGTVTDVNAAAIPELPIGTYEVTVTKANFTTARVTEVQVAVASERRTDVTLEVSGGAQSVDIQANAVQVESTTNTLGGTIAAREVADLPINGRDFTKFLVLVPGATGDPSGATDSPGSFGLFSSNGNRGRANNFLLDGTDMNDGYRNLPAINEAGVFGTPATILPIEA